MEQTNLKTCLTACGMYGIWDPEAFSNVKDFESWEAEIMDEAIFLEHIRNGNFVPININMDGARKIEVCVGSSKQQAQLSARASHYVIASSKPYLFNCQGALEFGGIEYIGRFDEDLVGFVELLPGRYTTTVHLLDWGAEPGSVDQDGKPDSNALPDFVVILNPSDGQIDSSNDPQTFPTDFVD